MSATDETLELHDRMERLILKATAQAAELLALRVVAEKARAMDKRYQHKHWGYDGTSSDSQEHEDLRAALAALDAARQEKP